MDCHKFLLHSVEILSPLPGIATFLVHYSCHDEGVSFHFQVEKVLQMIDVDLGNCGNLIHKLCKVTLTYSYDSKSVRSISHLSLKLSNSFHLITTGISICKSKENSRLPSGGTNIRGLQSHLQQIRDFKKF